MYKLSFENKIENLSKIAEFIEQFGEENNLSVKSVFELNLMLDELITNTINYGYKDAEVHTIDISVAKVENLVTMQIFDDAEEFNPLKSKEADLTAPLDKKNIGGLGIHFIKQKADDISYKREDNKNILTISKKV